MEGRGPGWRATVSMLTVPGRAFGTLKPARSLVAFVPDASDPSGGWEPHPDRRRFAAITGGLDFMQDARRAVSQLERGTWDDAVRPDGSRPPGLGDLVDRGDRTVAFLEGSPRGRDGTGRDLDVVLADVREWRDRLRATVRDNRAA